MVSVRDQVSTRELRISQRMRYPELYGLQPRYGHAPFQQSDDVRSDGRTLEGYAAVFDSPTVIESTLGDFEETIIRGAFRKTLRDRAPVLQFDHGNDKRTGTIPIGSIEEKHEDEHGLFVRAHLFDTPRVEDIRQAIAAQAIRGMSFKFEVLGERWLDADRQEIDSRDIPDLMEDPEAGTLRREITEVKLYELGPVVFPAYDQTSVGVRVAVNRASLRGLLARFGLREDCVRRHLSSFDADALRLLAAEIRRVFPQLAERSGAEQRTPAPLHDTDAVEQMWDAGRNVARLPSPMPVETARRVYAWYDGDRVEDGRVVKDACKLPHHEVNTDGSPGPANLAGVRNALSRLSQSDIPQDEQEAVRAHLRNHLPEEPEEDSKPPSAVAVRTSDDDPEAAPSTSGASARPVISHLASRSEQPVWMLPDLPFPRR